MNAVLTDYPADHVARLTINRPDAKNAIDKVTRLALIEALKSLLSDKNTRALVLCGANGLFCAGGDLLSMRGMTREQAQARMQSGHELVRLIYHAKIPVIAAVEKYAIGAGAGLALLTDSLVVGPSSLMRFPFLQLGLVPDWGSTQMLIRRVGWAKTKRLILEQATLKGDELLEIGIADALVADDQVMATSIEKAVALARLPQQAYQKFKACMSSFPTSFEEALETEERDQTECFLSEEFEEGLNAFLEKRPPNFMAK